MRSLSMPLTGREAPARSAVSGDVENFCRGRSEVSRSRVVRGCEDDHQDLTAGGDQAGKNAGEHVVVEVTDDGAGIDVSRVRQVANERKLKPPEAIAAMSDEEALDLIFLPGFSTAKTVRAQKFSA